MRKYISAITFWLLPGFLFLGCTVKIEPVDRVDSTIVYTQQAQRTISFQNIGVMLRESDPKLWVIQPDQVIGQESTPIIFKILKGVEKGTEIIVPACYPLFSGMDPRCGKCYVAASVLCGASFIGGATIGGVIGAFSSEDFESRSAQEVTLKTAFVAERIYEGIRDQLVNQNLSSVVRQKNTNSPDSIISHFL
ncbi:MAG: hypothetical protein ACPGYT_06815 [Nitrospirales bacterium]